MNSHSISKFKGLTKLTFIIVTAMLLVISFSLVGCGNFGDVSAQKALQLKNQGAIVLDIRSSLLYDQGHIEGSKNIDYNSGDFSEQLNKLDKNTAYLICGSKTDAASVVLLMKENSFKEVRAIKDGLEGWKEAGYPITIW